MTLPDLNDPNVQGPALIVLGLAFFALMVAADAVATFLSWLDDRRWNKELEASRKAKPNNL